MLSVVLVLLRAAVFGLKTHILEKSSLVFIYTLYIGLLYFIMITWSSPLLTCILLCLLLELSASPLLYPPPYFQYLNQSLEHNRVSVDWGMNAQLIFLLRSVFSSMKMMMVIDLGFLCLVVWQRVHKCMLTEYVSEWGRNWYWDAAF